MSEDQATKVASTTKSDQETKETPKRKMSEEQLKQLADAREKAKRKRQETQERLKQLEEKLETAVEPKRPVQKVKPATVVETELEESESEEEVKPASKKSKPAPRVIVKEAEEVKVAATNSEPSFMTELAKSALVGSLGLASWYVANFYGRKAAAPKAEDSTFQAPVNQPSVFNQPALKTPVGRSGFFTR